jgi:hypothetical protein
MAQPYNPFKDLVVRAGDVDRSVNWYRNQVQTLQKLNRSVNTMLSNSSQLRSRLYPGGLYLFHYDAKHKDTLPYWDSMPLVFPFRSVQDGFYGLNLHYLPYGVRFKLMGALLEVTHHTTDPKMRMQISWNILNSGAKFPGVGACVKHYLADHVQSRFLDIPHEQWLAASMMPIEQFQGANKEAVWRQSRKYI